MKGRKEVFFSRIEVRMSKHGEKKNKKREKI